MFIALLIVGVHHAKIYKDHFFHDSFNLMLASQIRGSCSVKWICVFVYTCFIVLGNFLILVWYSNNWAKFVTASVYNGRNDHHSQFRLFVDGLITLTVFAYPNGKNNSLCIASFPDSVPVPTTLYTICAKK